MAVPLIPIIMAATAVGSQMANNASSENAHKANNAAQDTLKSTAGYADAMKTSGEQILQQMLNGTQSIYGTNEQAAADLLAAKQGVNGVDPYEAGTFNYDKEIADFYDPAFQLSVNNANDSINGSQALGGNMFSSDTANKIAAQNQVLATNMYKDALGAYQTDKSLEQGIWQGNEAAKQAAASSAANLASQKYSMAADTAGNLNSTQNAAYQSLMGLNSDYYNNKTDYAAALAQMQSQDPGHRSWYSRLLDPFGTFS